jgi:hypothetical protein
MTGKTISRVSGQQPGAYIEDGDSNDTEQTGTVTGSRENDDESEMSNEDDENIIITTDHPYQKTQESNQEEWATHRRDPEQDAKEDYMKELMNFRKDEIILNQDKVLDGCDSNDDDEKEGKAKSYDVDAAYEIVDSIDNKMIQIANVLRGVDKRMSYNLRLVTSVMAFNDADLT